MSTGKILITGATGDTGGYMIEQLLQKRPPAPGPRPPHRRPLEAAGTQGRGGDRRRLPRPGGDASGGELLRLGIEVRRDAGQSLQRRDSDLYWHTT
jgi:uncharacterized protein YbjT (DUF2867 family)